MSATEIEYQPSDAKNAKKSGFQAFREYVYNSQDGTFFGRTGSSWGKIGVFYLVYYSCLTAFFAICLMIFYQTLSDEHPKHTGMHSILKENPGMAFRPMPKVSSTLIKFDPAQPDTYRKYVDNIKILLHKYKVEQSENDGDYQDSCTTSYDDSPNAPPCPFSVDDAAVGGFASKCNEANQYGYADGKPCVLMKLNKIFNFEPEGYVCEVNGTDAKCPAKPADEKDRVKDAVYLPDELNEYMPSYDPINKPGVAVTCVGENYGDVDNLGKVNFFPEEGFPQKFFPFKGQKGYQAPLVFAQLEEVQKGVLVNVYCKAWAKNIEHHKNDKAGSMRFEMLVE